MAKPSVDLDALTIDELAAMYDEVGHALAARRDARRAELLAELASLGGVPEAPKRTRTRAPVDEGEARERAKPAPLYRGPAGEEWSGRGAIPRWAKALGVQDKAGMGKYRIDAAAE